MSNTTLSGRAPITDAHWTQVRIHTGFDALDKRVNVVGDWLQALLNYSKTGMVDRG